MNDVTVLEVDRANRLCDWPKAASQAFGWASNVALGQSWVELFAARDPSGNRLCQRACGLHAMAQEGEAIGTFEIVATVASGETVRLFVKAEPSPRGRQLGLRLSLWRDRRRGSAERTRAGQPAAGASGAQKGQLTAREVEVLRLLSRGQQTDELAEHLGISITTVRNHVARVLSKLGARSRVEAVSIGFRRGLL